MKLCQEDRFSDDLNHFQRAGNQLRMTHALEDRQRQELTTILMESRFVQMDLFVQFSLARSLRVMPNLILISLIVRGPTIFLQYYYFLLRILVTFIYGYRQCFHSFDKSGHKFHFLKVSLFINFYLSISD